MLQEAQLPRVKWIISSRNNITESRKLNNSQSILSLELQENAVFMSRAISTYIADMTSRIESLQNDASLQEYVRRVLHQKAEGTFLWVALVVKELEDIKGWDIQNVVDTVPKGLNKLYDRMMDQIRRLQSKPEYCQLCDY